MIKKQVKKASIKTTTKQKQKKCKTLVKIKDKAVHTNKKNPTKFYLTDLSKCRSALNKMLNDLHNNPKANIPRVRAEAYLISSIISIFKLEKDYEIEQRLQDLESSIKNGSLSIATNEEALLS